VAHWTIDEGGGAPDRYFTTKLRASVLELELSYRRLDGRVRPLGEYRLPLLSLSMKGLVRKRADGQGYDIQIRVIDGEPFFSLNKASEAPMAPYRL